MNAVVLLLAALCLAGAAMANPENRPCPEVCTADFTPVCAVLWGDYQTFGNECELARTSCRLGQPWRVVAKCACVDDAVGSSAGSYRPSPGGGGK